MHIYSRYIKRVVDFLAAYNRNGIIVPPHDADRLHAAMLRFASDRQLVISLAANARPLVAERYEQGYVRQCLKDFYKEIG